MIYVGSSLELGSSPMPMKPMQPHYIRLSGQHETLMAMEHIHYQQLVGTLSLGLVSLEMAMELPKVVHQKPVWLVTRFAGHQLMAVNVSTLISWQVLMPPYMMVLM